jgi:hypothetical protein
MYWAFDNLESKRAGAFPPEPLDLPYGHRPAGARRLRGAELQRAYTATGREVHPSDCGPIRMIARFGHVVRAPGRVVIQRESPPRKWRDFQDDSSAYGAVRVSGDPWHGSESGFVAGWISGSEYVKINTGILVLFPRSDVLHQGPVPNRQLVDDPDFASARLDVMSGCEYFVPDRSRVVDGSPYGIAAINVIARAPRGDEVVEIRKGQIIAWFHVSGPLASQAVDPLPHPSSG